MALRGAVASDLSLYHRVPLTEPQNRATGRRDAPRVTNRKTNLP